mmetsp:Transcript_21250/g.56224  ORF Transcript_21250/g.56224 Transcript_21250/m.56224 type:complete len:874 (+) Transcript_21250:50-2671(+)
MRVAAMADERTLETFPGTVEPIQALLEEPVAALLEEPVATVAPSSEDPHLDDDSQTSLMSRRPEGYQPVEGSGPAPAAACSPKIGLVVVASMLLAGCVGFVFGADFGLAVVPKLRGSQSETGGGQPPSHKVIAVVPAGVEARAHRHEQVVTDAEEEPTHRASPARRGHVAALPTDASAHRGHIAALPTAVSTRANASKNGSNSSNESQHNETKHVRHEHVSPCNESAWPDKAEGLVCDDCKVPVNKFSYFYETCDNYCSLQGRRCVGSWEEEADNCNIKHAIKCDEILFSSDAICECSKKVNATLKRDFEDKVATKRSSTCGPIQDDVDFWTDGSLFSAGDVGSAEKCQEMCQGNPGCGAWTWGKQEGVPGLTHVCYLKKVDWGHPITYHNKTGLVSGHPYGPACGGFEPDYFTLMPKTGRHGDSERNTSHDKKDNSNASSWSNLTLTDNHGVIRSKQGVCLDAAAPGGNGSLVQMMICVPGKKSQQWAFTQKTGAIANQLGLCLAAESPQDLSSLRTLACDESDWDQKWDFYADKARIANWHGPCLDAAERNIDGGMVYMRGVCNEENPNQQWEWGPLENMTLHKGTLADRPMTLYCFALMLPGSYEQGLLAFQYRLKVSLFGCDAYSVYSNQAIKVAEGLVSGVVDSDLKCEKGGEFGTALNLPIFLAVWKKVVEDAIFKKHDWTVKVDPDAVFFPERLQGIVAMFPETEKGVYLNNCKFGLHGPIEVFSRHAVTTWSTGHKQCIDHFWKLCHGDCLWGEDLFIDQCLAKVLGAQRENDYRILTEDHCDPPKDWDSCTDESRVAFHPFKNETGYRTCLNNAEKARGGNANKYPEPPAPTTEKPHTTEAAHATEKPRTTEPASDTAEKLQAT